MMANHARRRTQSDCDGSRRNDPESKYSCWKSSRPELFRKRDPGSRGPMAANTATPIAVIADDQDLLIPLPSTYHDSVLDRSVIGKTKASATNGKIRATIPETLVTSSGRHLKSSATITLRWRYDAGMQSFQETFWIIDDLAGYDAILRKGIETLDAYEDGQGDMLFAMRFGMQDAKGKKDRENKEKQRQERDAEYRKQLAQQREHMKGAMENMKLQQAQRAP